MKAMPHVLTASCALLVGLTGGCVTGRLSSGEPRERMPYRCARRHFVNNSSGDVQQLNNSLVYPPNGHSSVVHENGVPVIRYHVSNVEAAEQARTVNSRVKRAVRVLVDEFCGIWRDPHPTKGYGWGIEDKSGRLRESLLDLKTRYDWRGRKIAAVLETYLMDRGLSRDLRNMLFEMLQDVRPRSEMRFFRAKLSSTDPWLRHAAAQYLSANRDPRALALEVERALAARTTEERIDALNSVSLYFSDEVEFEVPSSHWNILWADGTGHDATVAKLTDDVRAWWQENRSEFKN